MTVVIIVRVAEAMPDSWSEAIDFVHAACLPLVVLGPSFVLKKQVVVWVCQRYLVVGVVDVQTGYEESWSGMGWPCMMAHIEIGLDVGYVWGLRMQSLPGVGYKEGYLNSYVGLLYWSLKAVHEMILNFLLSSNLSHDRNNRDYDYTFLRQVMRGIT